MKPNLPKGLTKSEGDNADLFGAMEVSVGLEKEFTLTAPISATVPVGARLVRRWHGGNTMTTGYTSTIHIGEVGLDMYDADKKSRVGRGVATKTRDPKARPEKRQKNIMKGAAKLLKNYPASTEEGATRTG